ncbi:hypothetical protein D092_20850 [Rhodococcus ruber Chol-4]|uniref:DUF4913 domain-containing protein n=2 Tax=Rhodococcus TaxID=1827 RepID=A0ABQ0YR26_9NOCA|nr:MULTISPECIES: DUF4913 domain-containing protein [Rhodococcus]ETT23809.1 hypothetical protein RR21198_5296 [Rhodococcus rhodochrous ATCC 21198]KXF84371.1 hypothetical protein D092_20850 [Rhodococcus ruber Chol-4]MEE2062115.1 DUF4913 domain-containing protein [Rhodococcus artemisiae]NGP29416.1 DUF4913 domain-containing protein [Rhodococcus aetherivorans]GES38938.1 hypothetical protein RAJCM14343_4206 [Rhodococcus aetherivorans]
MVEVNTAASDEWATSNEAPDGDEYEDEYEPDEDTDEDETDEPADEYEDETDSPQKKEPKFANVIEWVNGFFLPVIRRRISDNDGGLSWDPRWWAYPEVVARLTALHQAWEEARVSDSMSAMSSWWIQHLEPHLRVILDGDTGPMANAKADRSFMGWPAMPADPVPSNVIENILNYYG